MKRSFKIMHAVIYTFLSIISKALMKYTVYIFLSTLTTEQNNICIF